MFRKALQKQERLPQQVGESRFIQTEDQRYEVLTFKDGEGPTLAQTIAIAKERGQELLTLDEARAIRDNEQTNAAFRSILKPGEWTYVRDKEWEGHTGAAYLDRDYDNRGLGAGYYYGGLLAVGYGGPVDAARVVVLKAKPSEGTIEALGEKVKKARKKLAEAQEGVKTAEQEYQMAIDAAKKKVETAEKLLRNPN